MLEVFNASGVSRLNFVYNFEFSTAFNSVKVHMFKLLI
jgi:hypothetical protein